jgi:hypothetical protein
MLEDLRSFDVDLLERRAELGHGRRHGLGVKSAADGQRHRIQPLALRLPCGPV